MNLSGLRIAEPNSDPVVFCVMRKHKLLYILSDQAEAEKALAYAVRYRKKRHKPKQFRIVERLVTASFGGGSQGLILDAGCLYNNVNLETLCDDCMVRTDTPSWIGLDGEVVVPRKLSWDGGKEISI